MFCQNCSAENAEDDRFCCQCGSPLRAEEQESGIEKRHTGRTIAFILTIVLGIMAAACGIFWLVGQRIPQAGTEMQKEYDQTAERETGSQESDLHTFAEKVVCSEKWGF